MAAGLPAPDEVVDGGDSGAATAAVVTALGPGVLRVISPAGGGCRTGLGGTGPDGRPAEPASLAAGPDMDVRYVGGGGCGGDGRGGRGGGARAPSASEDDDDDEGMTFVWFAAPAVKAAAVATMPGAGGRGP